MLSDGGCLMLGARERDLAERYPLVEWEAPVRVTVLDGRPDFGGRLCCRFCIALNGLKAVAVEKVGFGTLEEHEAHLKAAHEV